MYLKNIYTLSSASIVAQVINLIGVVLLARLYSPDAFGVYASFVATIYIVSVISTMRIEVLLPLSQSNERAVLLRILKIVIAVVCVCFIIAVGAYQKYTNLTIQLLPIILLGLALFSFSINKVVHFYLLSIQKFESIRNLKVLVVLSTLLLQVLLGMFISFNYYSLLAGFCIGFFITTYYYYRKTFYRDASEPLSKAELYSVYKKCKSYIKKEIPTSIFNVMAIELPVILIIYSFDPKLAGAYAIVQRVLAAPITLLSQSISQVFLTQAGRSTNKEQLSLARKLVLFCTCLSLPPVLLTHLYGKEIFTFVFGESWVMAGSISEILIWGVWGQFLFVPLSFTFIIKNKQIINMYLQGGLLFFRCVVLLFPSYLSSESTSLMLFSVGSLIIFLVGLALAFWSLGLDNKNEKRINC